MTWTHAHAWTFAAGDQLAFSWPVLDVDTWRFHFANLTAHLDGGSEVFVPDFTEQAPVLPARRSSGEL